MSTDLISQLESATEGSRELDEAIQAAVNPDDPWWMAICKGRELVADGQSDAAVVVDGVQHVLRAYTWAVGSRVPAYSTSIDTALTLVPKDWSWRAGNTPSGGFATLGTSLVEHMARTPAIALVIAALRARGL